MFIETAFHKTDKPHRGDHIEREQDQGSATLVRDNGATELGPMKADGSGFEPEKQADRDISFGKSANFRLLLKNSLLEFYLDDILIECFSLTAKAAGQIGLIDQTPGNVYKYYIAEGKE